MNRLSPYAALALLAVATVSPSALAAEMQWIWGTPGAASDAPVGTCQFEKTFTAGEGDTATVEIACDNRYVLRLNGRLVGASNRWEQLDRYDITELLNPGENTLTVRAINDEGAAGLAMRITLKPKGGQARTIVTDGSWKARLQGPGGWNPEAIKKLPYKPAHVLGAFGKLPPWGDRVVAAEVVHKIGKPQRDDLSAPLKLTDGDRIVLLGNTLIERAQEYGYLETALTTANPGKKLVFRNLGWSGDTVFGHARARFGSVKDGFAHLAEHVHGEKPTVILVAYGANDSFAGEAGLTEFIAGLETLLDTLESTGAKIVLLSPLKQEDHGRPLPDPTAHNRELRLYADAIAAAGQRRGHRFVDLYKLLGAESSAHPLPVDQRLTDRGVHLTGRGYWEAARAITEDLGITPQQAVAKINVASTESIGQSIELGEVTVSGGAVQFTAMRETLPRVTSPDQDEATQPTAIRPMAADAVNAASLTLSLAGLAPGKYRLKIDNTPAGAFEVKDAKQPTTVALVGGPDQQQANRLRALINKKNRLYFHRWRPQNETYLYLFRKHEQGNNAREIPQFDPLVAELETQIHELSVPTRHTYEITRIEE